MCCCLQNLQPLRPLWNSLDILGLGHVDAKTVALDPLLCEEPSCSEGQLPTQDPAGVSHPGNVLNDELIAADKGHKVTGIAKLAKSLDGLLFRNTSFYLCKTSYLLVPDGFGSFPLMITSQPVKCLPLLFVVTMSSEVLCAISIQTPEPQTIKQSSVQAQAESQLKSLVIPDLVFHKSK